MDSCFSCLAAWLRSVEGFTTAKTSQDTTTLECLCSVNSLAVFLSDLVVRPPAILSVHFLPGQPRVSNQNHTGVLAALAHWATFDNVCSRWPEQHRGVLHTSLGVCQSHWQNFWHRNNTDRYTTTVLLNVKMVSWDGNPELPTPSCLTKSQIAICRQPNGETERKSLKLLSKTQPGGYL